MSDYTKMMLMIAGYLTGWIMVGVLFGVVLWLLFP
jgi:hypothetical protein